ncbi:hypothetical protein FPV67DRAFT_1505045 [Lyophyllum atratum]|nr:hypothetical protein FPV67DRAFT_1505045 [Lyophyllum atratum]
MLGENIVVNDFMFCLDHGDEFCHLCCCDHRMCNNIRIEDDLGDLSDFVAFQVEDRQPRNAYAMGAVAAVTTEESYQCEKHKAVDCGKCFDWVKLVKKEAEATEERGGWAYKGSSAVGSFDEVD